MTHTPFVSNPCPATAIVFVSQNLFYGQLPQGCSFFCALSSVAALLGLRAHRARGFCSPKGLLLSLHRAGGESKGPFSFAKENGPFGTPRERLLIGSLRLECPFCLRNETACARQSRVSIARRFGLLLLSAAALLIL